MPPASTYQSLPLSPLPLQKVLHILPPQGMGWSGGIRATLASLGRSRLSQTTEFQWVGLDQSEPILRQWQPDVLVLNMASSWRGIPAVVRLKTRGKPVILVEHHYCQGFEQHSVPSPGRFRMMLRATYAGMDRVVAISAGQQRWMQSAGLTDPGKVRLIRSSRVLDPFWEVPELAQTGDRLVLGAYGRLTRQKGFDLLIQAVQQQPAGSVLLRLGGEGPEEALLRQLAAGSPSISFVGRLDDVPQFLRGCDAVVIPSRWEPWGNVCLEAKAAARPVIAADIDGLSEQTQDCGIRVKAGEVGALADGISTLLSASIQQRQKWGSLGRQQVEHAWADYVDAWDQLLQEFR